MVNDVSFALSEYNKTIRTLNERPDAPDYGRRAERAKLEFEERIMLIVEKYWKRIPNE